MAFETAYDPDSGFYNYHSLLTFFINAIEL